ncbi:MAG: YabP/YqfC family sporulation protein [Butyricicoccus pullicaecorum]|nr:YabP/YqfC family sporulation protein [Butyricicoccus pullicaecorum]
MLKDNLYAELMEDLHPNRPRVEILGDSRVIVENHCGIQEYDDSILRIKCRGCEVRILGADLELTALSMDELAVAAGLRAGARARDRRKPDAISQPVRGAGYHAAADGPHGME